MSDIRVRKPNAPKMTPQQRLLIRAAYASGQFKSYNALAKVFGVSASTARQAVLNNWALDNPINHYRKTRGLP